MSSVLLIKLKTDNGEGVHSTHIPSALFISLSYMLENPGAEELDLTFTTEERDEYGTVAIVDLALGGAAKAVNDRNKADYVQRLLQRRFQHGTEVCVFIVYYQRHVAPMLVDGTADKTRTRPTLPYLLAEAMSNDPRGALRSFALPCI